MSAAKSGLQRCAIYTRKSTEDGLEQDFNSLHAQREACEAYVLSQAGEGWKALSTCYDDGGFSGGTMDRPALKQLLADIGAHKIDIVVVYKVDRLTRSLADFAKIVEIFDSKSVSFVSVTQAFNTTSSMGRLTLNMLLSFAQFEREVTGERIRDKIAASKKKGMWMGGLVPLGYAPNGRTLTINEGEATTVRTIFKLYLEHANVRRVKEAADKLGLITKIRKGADGNLSGGRPLSRGYIYKLLGNPLYAGRIAHKDKVYDGQHKAIIDEETWEAVQAMLAGNTQGQPSTTRVSDPSLLLGKLFDEAGAPLSPSHAVKAGRRYRYYISRQLIGGTVADSATGWRLPAREIERIVSGAAANLIQDRAEITGAAREACLPADRIPQLLDKAERWQGKAIDLVERVELGPEEITLCLNLAPLIGEPGIIIRHVVPTRIRRRGVELRLVLDGAANGAATPRPDLASGKVRSIADLARVEGVSDRYVSHLLPLAFLAPDIIEAILAGTQPSDLTAEKLVKQIDLPLGWAQQKALLGFN